MTEANDTSPGAGLAAGRLPGLGFVRVAGANSTGFLQSMLSADIKALDIEDNVLTGWHDRAGRAQACLRVVRKADEYWLVLPGSLVSVVISGLQRFILRSKVELVDGSAQLAAAGVFVDGGRFEIYAPAAALDARIEAHRNEGVRELQTDEWEMADIRDGLPAVYPTLSSQFTAQMLNLDLIGGVSFTKGCYPGQEIIARTHHLGRAKRRMQRFVSDASGVTPGAQVFDSDGSRGGIVVRAASDGAVTEALIVTAVGRVTALLDADGNELSPASLPYDPG